MLRQSETWTGADGPNRDISAPRILCVAKDRYPPYRVDIVDLLSRQLDQAEVRFDWLMKREHSGPAESIQASPHERFLVLGSRRSMFAANARLVARVVNDTVRGRYDLVQVRDLPVTALAFLLIARVAARPFVYWMSFPQAEAPGHRARNREEKISAWRRPVMRLYSYLAGIIFYRLVLKGADHIVVQSDRMKADLVARGIDAAKMTPVPMGVSLEAYNRESIAPTSDPRLMDRISLVYVGTCMPVRRIDVLVRALGKLARVGRDAVLVIVGDVRPEDAMRLAAVAREENVTDRLVFTGHLPLAGALAYVKRAAVCLAPCPKDPLLLPGTPTKLIEYLAMGRPVVANDHPDQMHVLQSSGAGLIAPLSPDGFSDAIERLLDDPEGSELRAAQGPAWVAAHRSYAVLSRKVFALYEALLLRNPRRSAAGEQPRMRGKPLSTSTSRVQS